ncbi:NAP1-related protein 2 [Vitis vinifera]|uniref:NAP1-related protein 2 n=1 Tax=Vitis vinifera TaxID=29760 RepID=A0A438BUH0_VITVI|nr:NAP1-related protein 2 [Vitis vinifera]
MVADKGKKLKQSEKEEEVNSDHIDGDLVLSIEKLQEIQDDLEKINEEASDKVLEVEQKYNEIRKPIYDKRNDIIKSIPDFWLTAFLSHPALGDLLSEEDQKIFKYLSSLEVEDFKDVKSGYSITFVSSFLFPCSVRIEHLLKVQFVLIIQNFNPNPFFEDTKLKKTFTFLDEGITKISVTSIKWKDGMGIPNGVNHEKKGNKRPIADASFFSWFSETQQKISWTIFMMRKLMRKTLMAKMPMKREQILGRVDAGKSEGKLDIHVQGKGGDGSEEDDDDQEDDDEDDDDDEGDEDD